MNRTPEIIPNGIEPLHATDPNSQVVIEQLTASIKNVQDSLRLAENEPGWNKEVRHVVAVLSASRSGSSLLFKALSSAREVVAPAGEHEPWLFLSGNKYPFTASDEISDLQNTERFLHLLRNDLLVREDEVDGGEFGDLLWNRHPRLKPWCSGAYN
jgi:hypothetical protein